ncbi:MAG TPA: SsrA-binding protein SmpB [Fimbriimonadaceae bacterium]|nr:SsrA-binding protein SmpB [Fimbriimonadaceae bacterium]HRJ32227.1 SsrA-binding protein SmpB [Fimbriimonadaceae bacterium]
MGKKSNSSPEKTGPATVLNRRARFDYEILETLEVGLVLVGSEVKSIYQGRANLTDAYCVVRQDELWLINADVEPYEKASHYLQERRRDRKLLAHRKEITLLTRKSQEKGLAILPLKLYFSRGKVKVEIGLGRGKKQYDKRESIAKKETQRELDRARSEKY